MLKLIYLFLLLSNFIHADPVKIVGYYPNWAIYRQPAFKPDEIPGNLVTHINYAFAKVDKEGNISLTDPWADTDYRTNWTEEKPFWGNFGALKELKQKYPHLKTLISVGGWTLSDPFSEMAEDPAARSRFISQAIQFCQQYGFDGIDIDWEYPGFPEHQGRPQDKKNFTAVLKELHEAIKEAAKSVQPALLVTIASPAGPANLLNIEVEKIHPYLDWINLMTYDLHGPWGDSENTVTNHQAPLMPPKAGNPQLSLAHAVQYYLEKGVPSEKLVLGLPLYGRVFAQADGLHSSYKGPGSGTTQEAGIRFFYDIKSNLMDTYKLFWDDTAQSSYLYNPSNREWISFDDEQTLKLKCEWLREKQLGGAMVWELGLDTKPDWDAMHTIYKALH